MPQSYRKVASETFAVPAPYTRVSSWYRAMLRACGMPVESTGPLQHGFASLSAVSLDGLRYLSLTIHPVSPHLTEVRYVVQVLSLPPRPAASYLHGPFVRAVVVYRSVGVVAASNHVYRFTITWPATIARLSAAINRPTRIFVPDMGGGGAVVFTERAVLSFMRADGGTRTVRVGGDLFTLKVGKTRKLMDWNDRVMKRVARITHRRCTQSNACRLHGTRA
jgi:hypothetical protein